MISYGSAGVQAQVIAVPPPANVEVLQVQQLSGQVTELVERLDFTERVLAESRGTRELKPGR